MATSTCWSMALCAGLLGCAPPPSSEAEHDSAEPQVFERVWDTGIAYPALVRDGRWSTTSVSVLEERCEEDVVDEVTADMSWQFSGRTWGSDAYTIYRLGPVDPESTIDWVRCTVKQGEIACDPESESYGTTDWWYERHWSRWGVLLDAEEMVLEGEFYEASGSGADAGGYFSWATGSSCWVSYRSVVEWTAYDDVVE